ncbi:MAG: ABC transporter substrate-binding protein [Candidatus Altiarchaeia archaeon]
MYKPLSLSLLLFFCLLSCGCTQNVEQAADTSTTTLAQPIATEPATTTSTEGTSTTLSAPEARRSDTISFKEVTPENVISELRAGSIDYSFLSINQTLAESVLNDRDITLYPGSANIFNLLLNPAPGPNGSLNPFSFREVRYALNYMIDRLYDPEGANMGFVEPASLFVVPSESGYSLVSDIAGKYNYNYDPAKANKIIDAALSEAGAKKVGGKWFYNNDPVKITFYIRSEDERRAIGDRLSSELENAGFTVNRQYVLFDGVRKTVFGTDPAKLEWSIATESYTLGADEYDSQVINYMGAPWMGNMPGFGQEGWWQYENKDIDELGKRLYHSDYSSDSERKEIYKNLTEMIAQDAVRLYVAVKHDKSPARSDVTGLTASKRSGIRWHVNYVQARTLDGSLVIGERYIDAGPSNWNPVAGHDDIYSSEIMAALTDPPIDYDPVTQIPRPYRWNYSVQTGDISIPGDAFVWDVNSDSWVGVSQGAKVKSMVSFDLSRYIGSKWHDGSNITWADVLYGIAQRFEVKSDPNKLKTESSFADDSVRNFKGFRIVGNTLVVYLDYSHVNRNYIADFAVIKVDYPIDVLAAGDKAVYSDGLLAYTKSASESSNKTQMLINRKDSAGIVVGEMDKLTYADVRAEVNVLGIEYMSEKELKDRIKAADDWYQKYGHLVISDGPYYLTDYDLVNRKVSLNAFGE